MNFLTRLIERHRPGAPSPLPILEPRLLSRFEPVAQAGAPGGVERNMDVEAPRHSEIRIRRESTHALRQPLSQTQGEPAQMLDPRVSAVQSALDAALATIQIPASRITHIDPLERAQTTIDAPAARRARDSSPGTAQSSDAQSTDQRTTPLPPVPSPIPIVRPDVRVVSPQSTATGAQSYEEAPSAEPTIHVTIGRVDVRAVMAGATPPARPTPRSDKLSLEDYLRGRNRGAR